MNYERSPYPVQAAQWRDDKSNGEPVIDLAVTHDAYEDHDKRGDRLHVDFEGCSITMVPYDWLVFDNGQVHLMTNADFWNHYQSPDVEVKS